MDALNDVVARAREGDADAFAVVVRRFQDMAVGYGYSMLHDFQLAEDAAQEAFFEAYRTLPKLREPAAFAGWFRRIVFKQCDRITRRQSGRDGAARHRDRSRCPVQRDEEERKAQVVEAMRHLPEHERSTMTLFYIGGYSMEEVATFLEVPVSTIKGRLHSARERLRTMLVDTVADDLRARRPSRNEAFATAVVDLVKAARAGDAERVKALLQADPRLLVARDPMGNTALIVAVNSGHQALADLLFDAGVEPGLHESAAIGDVGRVTTALEQHPDQLDVYSPEGFTALALAAHFGHTEVMQVLIDRGADLESRGDASAGGDAAPRGALRPSGRRGAAADRARRRRHAGAGRRRPGSARDGRRCTTRPAWASARSCCRCSNAARISRDGTRKARRRSRSRSTRIITTLPTSCVHEVRNDDDPSFHDGDGHGTDSDTRSARSCKPSTGATTLASRSCSRAARR